MEQFRALSDIWHGFTTAVATLHAVTGPALREFCEAKSEEMATVLRLQHVDARGAARTLLRALLGGAAADVLEEVPPSHAEDPEDLRGLALRWFEDNALLLRESDQIACFWVLGPCVGHQLIPIATRLYHHHPSTGPEFAETMEEIFGPEIFEQIRAGGHGIDKR